MNESSPTYIPTCQPCRLGRKNTKSPGTSSFLSTGMPTWNCAGAEDGSGTFSDVLYVYIVNPLQSKPYEGLLPPKR